MSAIDPGSSSGTQTPPPAAPPSVHDIVKASEAGFNAAVGRQDAAADAPAPAAQPPVKDGAAAAEPPTKEAKAPETPAAPPAKQPYTAEELAAFDGNFDRRDFDRERLPADLLPYAKHLASGTGKYRARLEAVIREEMKAGGNQPTATAADPSKQPPAVNGDWKSNLERFLSEDEEDSAKGFAGLLATERGKHILSTMGYSDPAEREIVSELVSERTTNRAIAAVADGDDAPFPQYVKDDAFQSAVNEVLRSDDTLLADFNGRDVKRASYALATACGVVAGQRLSTLAATMKTREDAIATRETDLAARELKLKQDIEAANRNEPASPATAGQSAAPVRKQGESTRDIVARFGPPPAG